MAERNNFARVISPPSGSINSIGSNKSSSTTETTTTTKATMDRKPAAGTLPTNNIDSNEHDLNRNGRSENFAFRAPTVEQLQSVRRSDKNGNGGGSRRVNSVSSTEDIFLSNENDPFLRERGSNNNYNDYDNNNNNNNNKLDDVKQAQGDSDKLESFDSPIIQQKLRHPAVNHAVLLSQSSTGGSHIFHDDYYLSPSHPNSQTSLALLPSQTNHLSKSAPSITAITCSSTHVLVPSRPNGFLDAEYWWAVDLMHDPPLQQGATPLVRRCMLHQTDWDETFARIVLKAYKQFLAIVKYAKDWTGQLVVAPYFVKRMWQVHALDVVSYSHDCMLLCGHVVGGSHIEEKDELSSDELRKRQGFTMGILENEIDANYDEKIWSYDALEEETEDMNPDLNEERQERSNSLVHGYVTGSLPNESQRNNDDDDDDENNSNSSNNNDGENVKEVALGPNGTTRSAKNTSGESDNHSCASLLTPDTEIDSSPFLEISVRRGSVRSYFKLRPITKMRRLFKNIPYDKFGVNRENARLYLPARDERSEPTEIHPSHTVESLRLRDGDMIYLDEVAVNNVGEDNHENNSLRNEMDNGDARERQDASLTNPEQPGANAPPVAAAPAAAPIVIVVDDDEIATKEETEPSSSSNKVASADANEEEMPKNVDNEISAEEVPTRMAVADAKKKKRKRSSEIDDEITTEEEVVEPRSNRVTRADAKKKTNKKRTRSEVERLKMTVAFEGESNEEEETDETDSFKGTKPQKNNNQKDFGEAESGTTMSRPRRKTNRDFRFVPE